MVLLKDLKWWEKAVFYQIYPRSFADGNGDGIGDLAGMISRLDYLESLGVDAIWLSPHYPSPNIDCGYDISDYTAVAPEYGDLEQFQEFLDGAHRRGMKLILDLVLNHTSDQHAWFQESRSSRENPKRDWYVWKDGLDGGPPNNWNSPFGGSAWEWDAHTGQYYYHFFFKQQPDLNWRNPQVKEAMFNAVRFWLDRGVDGFRLDAIGTIYEHPDLPDHPVPMSGAQLRRELDRAESAEKRAELMRYWQQMEQYQIGQPGMHALMKELRAVIDEYDERMLIGEDEDLAYLGNGNDELHFVFNFPLMKTDRLSADWIRRNQRQRLAELRRISPQAWPCNTLGNHDSSRVYTRYADGVHDEELARLSLALMLTLRGTPFLYNGEEIGMTDLFLKDISLFQDTLGVWYYHTQVADLGVDAAEALYKASRLTRDKNRTPMQWANQPNAGFCPEDVTPWLPINPNYAAGINVHAQQHQAGSLWHFYRQMLRLRKDTPALIAGEYHEYHPSNRKVLAFIRTIPEQTCFVALNYSERFARVLLPTGYPQTRVLYSSFPMNKAAQPERWAKLPPYQFVILELS